MRWLPSWSIGGHVLFLAIGESEFDWLLDALVAPPPAADAATSRLLILAPTTLLWSLIAVPRSQNAASFSELASAWILGRGEIADEPSDATAATDLVLGRLHSAEQAHYLRYLAELPPQPSAAQNRIAAQLLLSGLEFSGGGAWGPIRSGWQARLRNFDFGLGALPFQTELRQAADAAEGPAPGRIAGRRTGEADVRRDAERIRALLQIGRQARLTTSDIQREKLAALRQLAYGASHEINNPLANISSRAQLLLMNEADPQRRRHLTSIHAQAMRAHEMICDMMLFAHPPQPVCERIDWSDFLPDCLAELQERCAGSGWVIDQAGEEIPAEVQLEIDRGLITSLFQALLQNACESRAAGRIEIRSYLDAQDALCVEIADNGPGVTPAQARHMFDPFYSGREAGRGLGFGLSKAWVIAHLHGGSLELLPTDSQGTTLRLRLPTAAVRRANATPDAVRR